MGYTKKELYKITSRLYKELRENPEFITLRKQNGREGEYNFQTEQITLDYRKSIISTMIHEYLHKWHPDKCETWILDHEKRIMNGLSTQQVKNIIKAFADSVCSI